LLEDIRARKLDVIVVYKVDRLTRSLADFAKLVELFDAHGVSFVSVTQQFNTTTSMGRLTLNVLLSFAQFEREVSGRRSAAARRRRRTVARCASRMEPAIRGAGIEPAIVAVRLGRRF
jgi:DNA invertase Pin-like site-specific DNA recombinase